MQYLSIGTISHGTLRPQDVLPELLFALEAVDQAAATQFNAELIELGFGYSQCGVAFDDDSDLWTDHEDTIHEITLELLDTLQGHAPPYTYVGPRPGDGADIGVWPDRDLIEMDKHDGELQSISDPSELDYCNTSCAALFVNDHGNTTLFLHDGDEWRETWSIV